VDDDGRSADVIQNPPRNRAAEVHASALRGRSVEGRRQVLEELRRLEIQLQTASALERRADLSANHALAAALRRRAQERRRIAEVIRAHLAEPDTSTGFVRRGPTPVRRDRTAS
jgi:hypothetical protein